MTSARQVGPPTEHEDQNFAQGFPRVVACLAGGLLTYPEPFDHRTSVALSTVADSAGDGAFEALRDALGHRAFQVSITEVVEGSPVPGRLIIDAIGVGLEGVEGLFGTFLHEIASAVQREQEEGHTQ